MQAYFLFSLFILGTLFGSFGSVIIYRLKSKEKGIIDGRSHCGSCGKILTSLDLIPIVSWVMHKGKCRVCKTKVSHIYPLLEISTGVLFALIGYFLIDMNVLFTGKPGEMIRLFFWLFVGFITILYIFYDILFLEIHEGIMLVGIVFIFLFLTIQTIFPHLNILPIYRPGIESIRIALFSIVISCIILGGLYLILLKELKEVYDVCILISAIGILAIFHFCSPFDISSIALINGIIGVLGIFSFFFLQILISGGTWMGGGDLRIAIFIGLLLGTSLSFPGIMITYIIGSIIGVGIIVAGKIKHGWKANIDTRIPFGPFLGVGCFIALFYSDVIGNFIEIYFKYM